MKKIIFVLAAALLSFSAFSLTPVKSKHSNVMALASSHEIFYFKVCKAMMGGKVEVYNPAGELMASQDLNKRKIIIDFYNMAPGDYIVKVVKGDMEEIFDFHKKGSANEMLINVPSSRLTTVQGK